MRVNTPRDGGYYCAQEDGIFLALDDDCLLIDSITGIRNQTYKLDDDGFEWGYVAVSDDKLYGSAQYDGAHYTEFWGGAAWYHLTTSNPISLSRSACAGHDRSAPAAQSTPHPAHN